MESDFSAVVNISQTRGITLQSTELCGCVKAKRWREIKDPITMTRKVLKSEKLQLNSVHKCRLHCHDSWGEATATAKLTTVFTQKIASMWFMTSAWQVNCLQGIAWERTVWNKQVLRKLYQVRSCAMLEEFYISKSKLHSRDYKSFEMGMCLRCFKKS